MSRQNTLRPIAVALGTTFAVSLAFSPITNAGQNPFTVTELSGGYMVADAGTHAEGKMEHDGKDTSAEGKCGEGKCGEKRAAHEGKCGEGKCGEKKKEAEGSGDKKS